MSSYLCYQETRHINAALIQHITFNEFLPMVLGKEVMHAHDLVLLKVALSINSWMTLRKECFWRDISGRLLWRVRPVHQPQRSLWLHQRCLQVKKSFLFCGGGGRVQLGSTVELAGESKRCFLWQRNIFMAGKYWKLCKSQHHTAIVKMGRGLKSIKYLLCQKILWTRPKQHHNIFRKKMHRTVKAMC